VKSDDHPGARANDRSVTPRASGCRVRLSPESKTRAPARVAPSLARWWFGGRSAGLRLDSSAARALATSSPGRSRSTSLCRSRASAAPRPASRAPQPQTPPVVTASRLGSFCSFFQGALRSLRRGWAVRRRVSASGVLFFKDRPPTPPLLSFFWGGWPGERHPGNRRDRRAN